MTANIVKQFAGFHEDMGCKDLDYASAMKDLINDRNTLSFARSFCETTPIEIPDWVVNPWQRPPVRPAALRYAREFHAEVYTQLRACTFPLRAEIEWGSSSAGAEKVRFELGEEVFRAWNVCMNCCMAERTRAAQSNVGI